MISIYIRDINGETHCVEVNPDGCVDDIKKGAAEAVGMDPRSIMLRNVDNLMLNDDTMLICDSELTNDDTLYIEHYSQFRFRNCGDAGEITDGDMKFSLVRARPDYTVALLEPPLEPTTISEWALHIRGSPRIDFGISPKESLDLNTHCRGIDTKNSVWHITGLTAPSNTGSYLTIYGDDSAGSVPYTPQEGVVIQFKFNGPMKTLTCEFQNYITREILECSPRPIYGMCSGYPIICLDDPSTVEVVLPVPSI